MYTLERLAMSDELSNEVGDPQATFEERDADLEDRLKFLIDEKQAKFEKQLKSSLDEQNAKSEERMQSLTATISKLSQELADMKVRETQASSQLESTIKKVIANYRPSLEKVGGKPTKHLVLANLIFYWRWMNQKEDKSDSYNSGYSSGYYASSSSQHDSIKLNWPSDLNCDELKHCTLLTANLRGNPRFFLATILDQCDTHAQAQQHLHNVTSKDENLYRVFGELILTLHLPSWLVSVSS